MNQAKNPEYRTGRVDIAVEQCATLTKTLSLLTPNPDQTFQNPPTLTHFVKCNIRNILIVKPLHFVI